VPITAINQSEGTVLVEPLAERAVVTARAQTSVLDALRVSDFAAVMDLSGVEAGVPEPVAVEATCSNEAVRVVAVEPEQQVVQLESIVTITLPVTMGVRGEVARGYRTLGTVVAPDEVAVRGAESDIEEVVEVIGFISVEGAREDVVELVNVVALADDGTVVSEVEVIPSVVEVEVGVRRRVGYKPDVEVVPDLLGDPAVGYRLGSVEVEPQTVTLEGLPSVLEELPGFVETLPISVTGATANLSVRTGLTLPTGVYVYGNNIVTVKVEVFPIQSSRAVTATVDVQDVRSGWVATPSPEVVDVILEGPDTILAGMTSDDLRVIVDVDGYSFGVHRVQPDVLVPESVTVVSVIPETIEVVLGVAPTVTPANTMTPTVTITPTGTSEP
jgi:YbbR domain-containing protein